MFIILLGDLGPLCPDLGAMSLEDSFVAPTFVPYDNGLMFAK